MVDTLRRPIDEQQMGFAIQFVGEGFGHDSTQIFCLRNDCDFETFEVVLKDVQL